MVDLVADGHVTQGDRLVGIEHVAELDAVCIASRGGEVLTFNFLSNEVIYLSTVCVFCGMGVAS